MKKVQRLDLVFENCEGLVIPAECINFFTVTRKNTLETIEEFLDGNYFTEDEFIVDGRLELKSFDKLTYIDNGSCSTISPISRLLTFKDITQLHFIFDDGSTTFYSIDWDEKSSCNTNNYQLLDLVDNILCIEWKGSGC